MSHLITAYPTHDYQPHEGTGPAMGRSAMDPLNEVIYELLGAQDYYTTAGSVGWGRYYHARELNRALEQLVAKPDLSGLGLEAQFLMASHAAALDANRGVWLYDQPVTLTMKPGRAPLKAGQVYIFFG